MNGVSISSACIVAVLSLSGQGPAGPAPEEARVLEVVQSYVAARERNDPARIGALFTDDADQLTSSGEWRRGRAAIVRGTLESSKRTGGTRSITIESVRFVMPEVGVADGRYDISGAAGGDRHMWTSFVVVRTADGWRIAAIRNMLPTAARR